MVKGEMFAPHVKFSPLPDKVRLAIKPIPVAPPSPPAKNTAE
jgi:hypothetical protein